MLAALSETDKAWLAGFIGKAGPWNSDSLIYHPWVIITSTDTKVLEDIQLVVSTQKRASLSRTAGQKAALRKIFIYNCAN